MATEDRNLDEDDTSTSKETALSLLPALKQELGAELVDGVPDHQLLKFLLWKTDVSRAAERFRAHVRWRESNAWAFGDGDETEDNHQQQKHKRLTVTDDPEIGRLLGGAFVVAPPSLTSPKYGGAAVIVGRLRKNDMKDGRTPVDVCRSLLYVIDRTLEREEAQLHGVVVFHDLQGLKRDNVHPAIPKMLLGGILGHFPLRIRGLYLLNAPWFFKVFFRVVSNLFFGKKLKQRTHFVDNLEDMYAVLDKKNMLTEHGGELDFDAEAWVEEQRRLEESGGAGSLSCCLIQK